MECCCYLLVIKIYNNLHSTLVDFYIYANIEPLEFKKKCEISLVLFTYIFIIQTEALLFFFFSD